MVAELRENSVKLENASLENRPESKNTVIIDNNKPKNLVIESKEPVKETIRCQVFRFIFSNFPLDLS